eukprot:209865_1
MISFSKTTVPARDRYRWKWIKASYIVYEKEQKQEQEQEQKQEQKPRGYTITFTGKNKRFSKCYQSIGKFVCDYAEEYSATEAINAMDSSKFIHIYTANLFYSPYRYSDEQYKQLFKHEIAAANLGLKLLLSNFAVNDYTAACIASFGTTARFMHEEYGIAPGALKRQGGERKNYLIKLQAMCTDHKEPPLDLAHCNKETDDPFKQEITIPEALQQPQSIATSQVLERSTMLHLGHKDYNNTRWGMNLKESRDLKEKHDEFKDCDILALAKQKTDELLELSTNNVFKNYFFAFNKWDALKGEKSSFNDKHVARVSSLYSASMGLKASSNKKAAGTTSTAASNKNDMETATSNNKKKTASNDTTNNTIAFEESSSDESDTNSSDSSSYEASSADSDSEEFTAVKGTRKRMARSTNKNVKKQKLK